MPATKLQQKARAKYITPKQLAEQYNLSPKTIYKLLAMPIFKEAIFKPTEKSIRVNQDKAYEIMNQYFNN